MGAYNTILVPCPKCGDEVEFQTKSGSCDYQSYKLNLAPIEDVTGIKGEIEECPNCRSRVTVDIQVFSYPRLAGNYDFED